MNLQDTFPNPVLKKDDKRARVIIWIVSALVFIGVAVLTKVKVQADLSFDPRIFATANAIINTMVAALLVGALLAVKSKKYLLHKKLMMIAIGLSVLFLVSYVCHHLLSGETKYGDVNHDDMLSAEEKTSAGWLRYVYYFILTTHIPLAGIVMPFILFTAYRALSGNYEKHKKLAKVTWPLWFYVAVTGVMVYLMISPYY